MRMKSSNVKKKVIWYSRLRTSGYRTPLFLGEYRRITPKLKLITTYYLWLIMKENVKQCPKGISLWTNFRNILLEES